MNPPDMPVDRPVGVFDSGLGGISVLRELRRRLPGEDYLYFADSAWCPYGVRPPDEIRERSAKVVGDLVAAGVKTVVIACNTASAMAVFSLRDTFPDVPLIGLEPAVKPAVERTKSGRVGVLATPRTVAGERLRWLIETYAAGVAVHRVAATGLVELVEAGILEGPEVDAALRPLLDPMIEVGVDMLVLGCTHYPFLRAPIERYMGPGVDVIDSGAAIARRLDTVLTATGLRRDRETTGTVRLATSGDPKAVGALAEHLFGEPLMAVDRVEDLVDSRHPTSDRLHETVAPRDAG